MADNTTLNTGTGGDVVRDIDRSGVKTQVMALDAGGSGGEKLIGNAGVGMPPADAPTSTTSGPTTTAGVTLWTLDTTFYPSVSVQLTGNFAGGVAFLTSNNNTNFWPLTGLDNDLNEIDTALSPGMYYLPARGRYVQAVTTGAFTGTVSSVAYLRAQQVPVDPGIVVSTDPAFPVVAGGIDPTGAVRRFRAGLDGALMLTDAPQLLTYSFPVTTTAATPPIDTTGYQSVTFQTSSGFNANILVESSNDGANWITQVLGNPLSTGSAPAGALLTASNFYVAQVFARWMRLRVSTWTAPSTVWAQLRSTPAGYSIPIDNTGFNKPMNVAAIGAQVPALGNGVSAAGSLRVNVASDNTAFGINIRGATTGNNISPFRIVTGTTGFIKASAGALFTLDVYNVNAAARFLHLYNKASAPTLSTDTPVYSIPLPPATGRSVPLSPDIGLPFATGIAWAYTTDNIAIPAAAGTSAEGFFSGTFI